MIVWVYRPLVACVVASLVGCGGCDRFETVLATDTQGRSVVSVFNACTTVGTTLDETIELRSPSGRRTPFFRFVPNGGQVGCPKLPGVQIPASPEATVKWDADGAIHLAISALYAIDERHDVVDGIPVKYDIGIVIADKCR
jgi:hypothetical protein